MATDVPDTSAAAIAEAELRVEAFNRFVAEERALDAAVGVIITGEPSACELTAATLALLTARVALHEAAVRHRGAVPPDDYNTRADAMLALAFVQAHIGLAHALDAVRADPVGLDVAGLARTARQIERLTEAINDLLANRHDDRPSQPGRPALRLVGGDAG